MNTRDKIVAVAEIAERLKSSETPGAKIIVAFGGFDLLSREIVKQLETARNGNTILVVGVDPKPAIDSLLPPEARAQLAAGLAAVDFVVIAEPKELRDRLHPTEMIELTFDLAPRLLARFRGSARA